LGLGDRCFWVLEPTAEMPRVVWEVLGRLDGRMRVAYHQCQDRSGTKISSLRVDMGNPGLWRIL